MNYIIFTFLIISILAETVQQLSFKLAGKNRNNFLIFCPLGAIAYLLFLAIWVKVLKVVPLGVALPVMGLNYVAVAFTGNLFFKESITLKRWIGIIFISIGTVLVCMNGAKYL